MLTSLFLVLAGGGGLAIILTTTLPNLGPRWLFFFLTLLGGTGLAMPVVYLINRRVPSNPPATSSIVVRQALWFGIYLDLLAWLQLGRVLNSSLSVFLGAGFVVIEVLLRMNERSRWKPVKTVGD